MDCPWRWRRQHSLEAIGQQRLFAVNSSLAHSIALLFRYNGMSAGDVTMATAQQLEQPTTDLYERDFLAWTENQAEALRTRQVGAIDWVNLLEEEVCNMPDKPLPPIN